MLLDIFRLFEMERRVSTAGLLAAWSSPGFPPSSSPDEALLRLEPTRVFKTCLHFPMWRRFETGVEGQEADVGDNQLYDPVFVMLLFARVVDEGLQRSTLRYVELFRTNAVSLLIRALSAKDAVVRSIALQQLTAVWQILQVRLTVILASFRRLMWIHRRLTCKNNHTSYT